VVYHSFTWLKMLLFSGWGHMARKAHNNNNNNFSMYEITAVIYSTIPFHWNVPCCVPRRRRRIHRRLWNIIMRSLCHRRIWGQCSTSTPSTNPSSLRVGHWDATLYHIKIPEWLRESYIALSGSISYSVLQLLFSATAAFIVCCSFCFVCFRFVCFLLGQICYWTDSRFLFTICDTCLHCHPSCKPSRTTVSVRGRCFWWPRVMARMLWDLTLSAISAGHQCWPVCLSWDY